ncbi:MAG: hypothetical protein HY544_04305 [Candidatus Diapherotrites archaeon]|uniref:Uncharacterized protein n=1 Tax=Candidatus Iainarchaeum sp. TaxID=3101447 RepID=A0A8T3YRC5_9ARCH|nr:hypothetical protein [Candidatus Diapherotrites archaeon]
MHIPARNAIAISDRLKTHAGWLKSMAMQRGNNGNGHLNGVRIDAMTPRKHRRQLLFAAGDGKREAFRKAWAGAENLREKVGRKLHGPEIRKKDAVKIKRLMEEHTLAQERMAEKNIGRTGVHRRRLGKMEKGSAEARYTELRMARHQSKGAAFRDAHRHSAALQKTVFGLLGEWKNS